MKIVQQRFVVWDLRWTQQHQLQERHIWRLVQRLVQAMARGCRLQLELRWSWLGVVEEEQPKWLLEEGVEERPK